MLVIYVMKARYKMTTKKVFMAVADCIAKSRCDNCAHDVESGINQGCQDIAYRLADYFEQDNLRFNRQRFLDACFKD